VTSAHFSFFLLHEVTSLTALLVLVMASFQAVLIGLQDYALKKKHLPWLKYFPALERMEKLLFLLVWLGFISLSVGIVTGAFFSFTDLLSDYLLHKTILSLVAWLIFAVLLCGRHFGGWRGAFAVRATLIGMALLLLAYFGSHAVGGVDNSTISGGTH